MPASRLLALFLGASALAGCAVGPSYRRPTVQLPAHFMGQAAITKQHASAPADLTKWWQSFDDPLLTHFISIALEQNLDLAQAAARVTQARAVLGGTEAALRPSGDISGSASRAYQSTETPLGQLLNATPHYHRLGSAYEADLGASWEIDIFGGLRRGREAALADYQASQAGVVATQLEVAAQTAEIYITIRGLQTRLAIARRKVKVEQELLAKVRLLHSRGLVAEYRLRQAAAKLAQVRATVPVLQTRLDAAMNALDVILGSSPGTHRAELATRAPIPVTPRIVSLGSPAELLQRRPDLIVAERHLAAANARIGQAISEYYPKFSLSGLLGSAAVASTGNLFSGGSSQAAGVLGLRWRLFDFGRIDAQIQVAKGQDAEALAAYRQAVLRATEDVENSFSALINSEEETETLSQAETSLARARDSSSTAYRHGAASLIDVLHADETLLDASDAQAQSRTESAYAAIAVFKALGGGWQGH